MRLPAKAFTRPELIVVLHDTSKSNQDLSPGNVAKVTARSYFDVGATAWTLPKPAFA